MFHQPVAEGSDPGYRLNASHSCSNHKYSCVHLQEPLTQLLQRINELSCNQSTHLSARLVCAFTNAADTAAAKHEQTMLHTDQARGSLQQCGRLASGDSSASGRDFKPSGQRMHLNWRPYACNIVPDILMYMLDAA